MLAHGYGCGQDMWRRFLPCFADDYRLVLFDHMGAGHSDVGAYDREKYGSLDDPAAGYEGGFSREAIEGLLGETLKQTDHWRREGPRGVGLEFAVNLSAPPA